MGRQQEEAREQQALIPAPIATIKLDGWWNRPERHGAMFDLAASEDVKLREGEVKVIPLGIRMKLPEGHFGLVVPRSSTCLKRGILMANSVGIIEPDYCGDNDVWGFVAYAVRDTAIAKGTRIAQFMPVPMFGDLDFHVVDSMPYTDRGGYGSTGSTSAEGQTAEGRTYRGANGLELHVGDYVIDEFGERYCVMGLHEGDGATAAYADLGNSRTSLEVAPCLSLRLDERPSRLFHECPDSWEKLEEDARKRICDYAHAPRDDDGLVMCDGCRFHKPETGLNCIQSFGIDLVKRAKRLAGIEEEQR